MLKSLARDFRQRECPKESLVALEKTDTGFTSKLWRKADKSGWIGMIMTP
ncbi:hypothetical protein ACFLVW_04040 [Chloroflexota bacterium]